MSISSSRPCRLRRFHRLPALPGLAAAAFLLLSTVPAGAQTNTNRTTGNNTANRTNTSAGNSNTANRGNNTNNTSASSSTSASGTRQYRNNTQLGDALIQIDPETRSLVIVADEQTHAEIVRIIKNLDKPKPQVLIKVLFAQVTLDDSTDFGVEGGYAFNTGQPVIPQLLTSATQAATGIVTGSVAPTSTTVAPTGSTPTGGTQTMTPPTAQPAVIGSNGLGIAQTNFGAAAQTTGAFFRLNTNNATATLYALQQKGKVNILSRPSILARNNQEAVIVVGQEVPIPTTNQITEAGQTINSVSYQDVGIILRVTPFITVNKTVEMIVSPEISSLSTQTVAISSNFNAPIINKTSAETVVVTPDKTTVVIGGLMQKQETSNVSKVPLLGDIPYLGNAFKRTTKTSTKNELLIFLTPYIVEGTDNLEADAADQLNRTDLPQETFTPRDVHQYLDDTLQLNTPPVAKPVLNTTTTTTRRTTTKTGK